MPQNQSNMLTQWNYTEYNNNSKKSEKSIS